MKEKIRKGKEKKRQKYWNDSMSQEMTEVKEIVEDMEESIKTKEEIFAKFREQAQIQYGSIRNTKKKQQNVVEEIRGNMEQYQYFSILVSKKISKGIIACHSLGMKNNCKFS